MKKGLFWVGLTLAVATMGVADIKSAQAAAWHQGTPKALRHTWFYNGKGDNKAYITYGKSKSTGNLFGLDSEKRRYYRLPGYGLKKIRYQSLGKQVYRLSGVQYSPKGSTVQFDGQRLSYKVKLTKHQLRFYKGYRHYVRKATFPVMRMPTALK